MKTSALAEEIDLTAGQIAGQITAHAAVGGVTSVAGGGKFGHGFIAAGFAKGIGTPIYDITGGNATAGFVATIVIGGTTSEISGGKFANGARTAAYQFLFNALSASAERVLKVSNLAADISDAVDFKSGIEGMFERSKAYATAMDKIGRMSERELEMYFPNYAFSALSLGARRDLAQLEYHRMYQNKLFISVISDGVSMGGSVYFNVAASYTSPLLQFTFNALGYATEWIR